jgi:hypothetical protein
MCETFVNQIHDAAAGPLVIEKRTVFLEPIGAQLRMRGLRRLTDLDIAHGAARAGARAAAGQANE